MRRPVHGDAASQPARAELRLAGQCCACCAGSRTGAPIFPVQPWRARRGRCWTRCSGRRPRRSSMPGRGAPCPRPPCGSWCSARPRACGRPAPSPGTRSASWTPTRCAAALGCSRLLSGCHHEFVGHAHPGPSAAGLCGGLPGGHARQGHRGSPERRLLPGAQPLGAASSCAWQSCTCGRNTPWSGAPQDEFKFYYEDAKSRLVLVPASGNAQAEAAAGALKVPMASLAVRLGSGAAPRAVLPSTGAGWAVPEPASLRACRGAKDRAQRAHARPHGAEQHQRCGARRPARRCGAAAAHQRHDVAPQGCAAQPRQPARQPGQHCGHIPHDGRRPVGAAASVRVRRRKLAACSTSRPGCRPALWPAWAQLQRDVVCLCMRHLQLAALAAGGCVRPPLSVTEQTALRLLPP